MGNFLLQEKPEPENFPHTKDSFAFRTALGVGLISDGDIYNYRKIATAYIEHALNAWDKESVTKIEPDRQAQIAVLLTLGGLMLPRNGYDVYHRDPYHSTLPSQIESTIEKSCRISDSERQQLIDFQKRVAKLSEQSEMFANPMKFALDYYTGKEQQVLHDLVVGSRKDVLPSPSV